jgi:ABC-type multidrug transport system ATPase subunit
VYCSHHTFYVSSYFGGSNLRPEADYLADRIGIMVQGSLRCIGSGTHLKRTYGKGYKLTLTCPFDETTRAGIKEYDFFCVASF